MGVHQNDRGPSTNTQCIPRSEQSQEATALVLALNRSRDPKGGRCPLSVVRCGPTQSQNVAGPPAEGRGGQGLALHTTDNGQRTTDYNPFCQRSIPETTHRSSHLRNVRCTSVGS